jgi:hypothetical protein
LPLVIQKGNAEFWRGALSQLKGRRDLGADRKKHLSLPQFTDRKSQATGSAAGGRQLSCKRVTNRFRWLASTRRRLWVDLHVGQFILTAL